MYVIYHMHVKCSYVYVYIYFVETDGKLARYYSYISCMSGVLMGCIFCDEQTLAIRFKGLILLGSISRASQIWTSAVFYCYLHNSADNLSCDVIIIMWTFYNPDTVSSTDTKKLKYVLWKKWDGGIYLLRQ